MLGSPGGSVIIQFVVKTVVGMLDWGLDPQQAVSMVDFGAANSPKTNVGGEHPDHRHLRQRRPRPAVVRACASSDTRSTWPTSPAGCRRSSATHRAGRRRRSAPRGSGHGRHPVSARVTRLTESDWRVFAVIRLRALTDSLGENDPQYQQRGRPSPPRSGGAGCAIMRSSPRWSATVPSG